MNEKTLKKIKSLAMAKYRQSSGLFVAEGPHVVESFISNCADSAKNRRTWEIETIYYTERMSQLAVTAGKIGIDTEQVDARVFGKISDTKSPQGILALIKIPRNDLSKILECDRILIADGISDPGNMGTIIRSAAAFGFSGLIAGQGSADLFGPKVVRASQGAMAHVNLFNRVSNKQLKEAIAGNFFIIALTSKGNIDLADASIGGGKLGLIIGSEIKGICPDLLELAKSKVRIPISNKIESLNASVAACIAMYYLTRMK